MTVNVKTYLMEDYIKDNHLTQKEFCNKCGISLSAYKRLFKENCNPYVRTLFKISRTFGIHIPDLLEN